MLEVRTYVPMALELLTGTNERAIRMRMCFWEAPSLSSRLLYKSYLLWYFLNVDYEVQQANTLNVGNISKGM